MSKFYRIFAALFLVFSPLLLSASPAYATSVTFTSHSIGATGTYSASHSGIVASFHWETGEDPFPNGQATYGITSDEPLSELTFQATGSCPDNDGSSSSGFPTVRFTDSFGFQVTTDGTGGFYTWSGAFWPVQLEVFLRAPNTVDPNPEYTYDCTFTIYSINSIVVASATPTLSPTPTRTSTVVPTFSSACLPTFTPNPALTRTATPFGAATATRDLTPRTPTPFPTLSLPPIGVGMIEGFPALSSSRWSIEGSAVSWSSEVGHSGSGSIVFDLTPNHDGSLTRRLIYPFPVSEEWYVEGWVRFGDDTDVSTESEIATLGAYYWNEDHWSFAGDFDEPEFRAVLSYPSDGTSWRSFRLSVGGNYPAFAIIQSTAVNFEDDSVLYVDDLVFRSRGYGGGGGDCGPVATAAPLPTVVYEAPCGEVGLDVCIDPVDTDPYCLGYDGFSIEIPGLDPLLVTGFMACLEPYEITALSIGGQSFYWLVVLTLTGFPVFLMFQFIRTTRS